MGCDVYLDLDLQKMFDKVPHTKYVIKIEGDEMKGCAATWIDN